MDDLPILIAPSGALIFVRYPNRKSTNLYVWFKDGPLHCCNCDGGQDLEPTEAALLEHIHSHDTRKVHRRPVYLHRSEAQS